LTSRQDLRKAIRHKRLSLSKQVQQTSAIQLCKHLCTYEKVLQAQHIALYLTNDGELNTIPFIEWCWTQKKNIYLPVIHPFSKGQLLFLQYTNDTPMVQNHFGIDEPKLNVNLIQPVTDIDIIFTPLVAFDKSGERLGMGGGFYDRTLARWYGKYHFDKSTRPYPIGLAHNCQQVEHIPSEHWDVPIPEIITPNKHFYF